MGNLASQESRLDEVYKQIQAKSQQDPYRSQVAVLRGFRGVDTLTGMVFITEPASRQTSTYLREGAGGEAQIADC